MSPFDPLDPVIPDSGIPYPSPGMLAEQLLADYVVGLSGQQALSDEALGKIKADFNVIKDLVDIHADVLNRTTLSMTQGQLNLLSQLRALKDQRLYDVASSTLAIPRASFEAWCKGAGKPIVDEIEARITQEIKKSTKKKGTSSTKEVEEASFTALAVEVLADLLGVENTVQAIEGLYQRQTQELFTGTHIIDIVGKVMSDVVGKVAGPLEDLVKDLPKALASLLIEKIRNSRANAKKSPQ